MKLVTDAQDLPRKGRRRRCKAECERSSPATIPPFGRRSTCARRFLASQGKYDLALKDCNAALRQDRGLVEAALLRANINVRLGKYAEAQKEFNYLVSLHPRSVTLARVLSDRAWFYSTCPIASFRNGQQAIKDAKAACSIMVWKDEHMIDTLAVAYAETGDFSSAAQYVSQALAVKGISANSTKLFQRHLTSFQQQKPIRL